MSIKITTPDGREVWDDDLSLAWREALRTGGDKPIRAVLDHLELIAQVPSAYGEATSFAARTALELIVELAEAAKVELLGLPSDV